MLYILSLDCILHRITQSKMVSISSSSSPVLRSSRQWLQNLYNLQRLMFQIFVEPWDQGCMCRACLSTLHWLSHLAWRLSRYNIDPLTRVFIFPSSQGMGCLNSTAFWLIHKSFQLLWFFCTLAFCASSTSLAHKFTCACSFSYSRYPWNWSGRK